MRSVRNQTFSARCASVTAATWPVVFVRSVVSACLRKETTDALHIIGIAKPTRHRSGNAAASGTSQPEQIRSDWYANVARCSDFSGQFGVTRPVGLSQGNRGRDSGWVCDRFHCKSIPSAVSRMLVLTSGDPLRHAYHGVSRVRIGPRCDLDLHHSAPLVRVIAVRRVKNCEESGFSGSRLFRTPKRSQHKSNDFRAAPDLGALHE